MTNAGKLEIDPQCSTTMGGLGLSWPALSSVGIQQLKSCSTASTTEPSWLAVASKNISTVSLHGPAPVNCGGLAFLAFVAGSRFHSAVLAIVTSLGLNWKAIAPRFAPGLPLFGGDGS